jgi:outer membrane cobalamin receptor
MAGLTYTFPDATKIYGSVAHKSRFPNLSELYSSTGGNVDLETEESWNYTVGVSRPISTFAKAGLSFFYYDVSNMITRDAPPPIATYVNYGKVQLAGVEVNAEVYPIDGLILRVDYTYENARNQNDGRVTDNVPDIPNHKVDFGIQYQVPVVKTKLNFSMIYISSTYSQLPTQASPLTPELMASDYTIFDVKITQPIWKYFEAYVACKNIFDKNYEPEVGYPNPGRNFWVGLSAKF